MARASKGSSAPRTLALLPAFLHSCNHIPQDPKASLCRFLRRERIASDVTPVKEIVEGQAWLRLGPQIANPDLSQ
ncbi:hypothetical protein Zm00014a_043033 [Zea mays]|uniref:Uncharacterized protein n=1 Tax=Zea mays TaxID=4577 RepID=A0A3L6F4Y7_MAIZE|nr:hypothetical protein Zm00014a_043033 [Zea mays]